MPHNPLLNQVEGGSLMTHYLHVTHWWTGTLVMLGFIQRTKCGEAAFIFSIRTWREFCEQDRNTRVPKLYFNFIVVMVTSGSYHVQQRPRTHFLQAWNESISIQTGESMVCLQPFEMLFRYETETILITTDVTYLSTNHFTMPPEWCPNMLWIINKYWGYWPWTVLQLWVLFLLLQTSVCPMWLI